MKKFTKIFLVSTALFSLIFTAYAVEQTEEGNGYETPEATLLALFEAARNEDFSHVGALCDPMQENDGDTDCICALDPSYVPHKCSPRKQKKFTAELIIDYFAPAQITGETEYDGDFARIPFLFGPPEERDNETMLLIRRGKFWYLGSF